MLNESRGHRRARRPFRAVLSGLAALAMSLGAGSGVLGAADSPASAASSAPVVSSIAPVSGASGTVVSVTGTGLSTGTTVSLGGIDVTPVALAGGTGISFAVPGGLAPGSATLALSDAGGALTTATFKVLPPLLVTTSSLAALETGLAVSDQLAATGGAPPYRWRAPGGLPAGLKLSGSGLLSGRPTTAATSALEVSVTDARHLVVSGAVTLDIAQGPVVSISSLPSGTVGTPYSVTLAAGGGVPPYTWSIDSGPVPGGLVLSSDGLLSGRPGAPGATQIDLRVTDSLGALASASLPIDFAPPPPPPQSLVLATAGGEFFSYESGPFAQAFPPATRARPRGRTVAVAATPGATGYWAVNSAGRVTALGSARNYGSVGRRHLSGRIVAIALTPAANGYWLLSSTGHVYGFGAARSFGSLPRPSARGRRGVRGRVVGLAAAGEGLGYWIVTATSQVVAFGSARGLALGAARSGKPLLAGHVDVTAVASAPGGLGFWLATESGAVHGFGAAAASASAQRAHGPPIVGLAPAPDGAGYWVVTASGGITAFGSAGPVTPVSGFGPSSGVVALASGT